MECLVWKHVAPYPSIAWFKDGAQVQQGPTVVIEAKYTDGTLSHFRLKLSLTNISADARGLYYCVAMNGLGKVQSDSVYVDLEGRLLSGVPGL